MDAVRPGAVDGYVFLPVLAVEGFFWLFHDLAAYLSDPSHREQMMEVLDLIEADRSIIGSSAYFMSVEAVR